MTTPTNTDNIIDTRELIEALEERQGIVDALAEAVESGDAAAIATEEDELAAWDEDNAGLVEFAAECEDTFSDYHHGEMLISDGYFETYAQELAYDIGAVPSDVSWPLTCFDWDAAAEALQVDYTSVVWNGATYWGRA